MISDEFIKYVSEVKHRDAKNDNWNGYVVVKKAIFPDGYNFIYTEIKGKEKVGFLLYDKNRIKPYGILIQYQPSHEVFAYGVFSGSIDKDKSIYEILKDEVKEESGYTVTDSDIFLMSKELVSINSSEKTNLFLVDVTDKEMGDKIPDNHFEENTEIEWLNSEEIFDNCEWKAKIIVLEHIRNM